MRQALPEREVLLLDEANRLVTEPGKLGELVVRGLSVAISYVGNPEATARSFVQNPQNSLCHDRWKRILTHDLAKWDNSRAYLRSFVVNTEVKPAHNVNYMARTSEVSVVPRENQEYLRLMVDYCRAHGATPVLVSTPSTVNWSTPRHNGIARLARRMGVDYIDLNRGRHKVNVDWRWDTRDRGDHLNLSGATKVSRELGALLSRRYKLPDHHNDPTYATWEEDLDRYRAAVGAWRTRTPSQAHH